MKLNDKKLWLVSDPTPNGEWADVLYGPATWKFFIRTVLGRGLNYDEGNEAVYDNEREARRDAEARWEKEQDRRAKAKKAYTYDRTTSHG